MKQLVAIFCWDDFEESREFDSEERAQGFCEGLSYKGKSGWSGRLIPQDLEELKEDEPELYEQVEHLIPVAPAPPTRTGKKVNVQGRMDEARGIEYLGDAWEMSDGTWRCLANVRGMLCLVEVTITELKEPECPPSS